MRPTLILLLFAAWLAGLAATSAPGTARDSSLVTKFSAEHGKPPADEPPGGKKPKPPKQH